MSKIQYKDWDFNIHEKMVGLNQITPLKQDDYNKIYTCFSNVIDSLEHADCVSNETLDEMIFRAVGMTYIATKKYKLMS